MNASKILLLAAAGCFLAGPLQADIYEWTDENGVRHFTNYAPPEDATLLMRAEEVPYDEAADRARVEADRQYQLERARLELAEREAELIRREAEAERRAAEAERYAAETERAADQYLVDAVNDRQYDYYRVGGYYGDYPSPYYRRWYYHKYKISHYYIKPYQRIYPRKGRDGYPKKKYGYKHDQKRLTYPRRYPSMHSLRSRSPRIHGGHRVNARSGGQMGGGHGLRGSIGRRY